VVKSHENGEINFKIKKSTPFIKVINAYCKKLGVDPGSFQFMFNGIRIQNEETPNDLDMEDLSTVDVKVAATGGCGFLYGRNTIMEFGKR